MNWQGWIFMLLVWSLIGIFFFFSFYRILFDKRAQKQKENLEEKNKGRSSGG